MDAKALCSTAVTPPRADAALPKMECGSARRPSCCRSEQLGAEGRKMDDADCSRLKDLTGELKALRWSGRGSAAPSSRHGASVLHGELGCHQSLDFLTLRAGRE